LTPRSQQNTGSHPKNGFQEEPGRQGRPFGSKRFAGGHPVAQEGGRDPEAEGGKGIDSLSLWHTCHNPWTNVFFSIVLSKNCRFLLRILLVNAEMNFNIVFQDKRHFFAENGEENC
jgi:hypothetical protein